MNDEFTAVALEASFRVTQNATYGIKLSERFATSYVNAASNLMIKQFAAMDMFGPANAVQSRTVKIVL